MRVLVAQGDDAVPIGAFGPPLRERDIDLVPWWAWQEMPPHEGELQAAFMVPW